MKKTQKFLGIKGLDLTHVLLAICLVLTLVLIYRRYERFSERFEDPTEAPDYIEKLFREGVDTPN